MLKSLAIEFEFPMVFPCVWLVMPLEPFSLLLLSNSAVSDIAQKRAKKFLCTYYSLHSILLVKVLNSQVTF